jgi:hypothetical protein
MANALTEHQQEDSYSCPSCHALGLPLQFIDILALIKKAGLGRFCPGRINFPRIYIPANMNPFVAFLRRIRHPIHGFYPKN